MLEFSSWVDRLLSKLILSPKTKCQCNLQCKVRRVCFIRSNHGHFWHWVELSWDWCRDRETCGTMVDAPRFFSMVHNLDRNTCKASEIRFNPWEGKSFSCGVNCFFCLYVAMLFDKMKFKKFWFKLGPLLKVPDLVPIVSCVVFVKHGDKLLMWETLPQNDRQSHSFSRQLQPLSRRNKYPQGKFVRYVLPQITYWHFSWLFMENYA